MALNAVGGLAQGLAQGIDMGMRWHGLSQSIGLQKQRQERLEKRDERDAEIHEMKKDQFASEKEIRDRRNNALNEIAQYTQSIMGGGQQPQQQQNINVAGPVPAGGLGGAAPMASDSGTLAAAPQAAQQPQEQAQAMPPGKVLERGMVTGMYSPKMLTDIASIWAKHGLQDEGIKYMNQAYEAEKRGGVRASMALMQNNPAAAAKALQAGGVELKGVPVKVNDDPNDFRWKLNIAGQGETTADVRQWLRSTMDPEEFFKAEDRRAKDEREASLDERKFERQQRLDERKFGLEQRKTDAQIGYLQSRSQLAEANANRAESGALRPTRSSEAQINTALTRRDKAFDRVSMVKDEFGGKPEIDPMRRQVLDSAANQYLTFIEDRRGEELDAREHHKFTDAMVSFPVNGTQEQITAWENKQLLPRFGMKRKTQKEARDEGATRQVSSPPANGGLAPAERRQPSARTGALSSLDRDRQSAAINKEMEGVQRALKTPNLSTEQRQALALQAQEIAKRRDALKRKRGQSSDPESKPVPDYGLRRDGSKKGTGWLGIKKTKSGNDMTEYTVGLEINGNEMDVPTLVPTLNQKEIDYLKTEPDLRERNPINDSIIRKAKEHAEKRIREGKSVFAD